MDFAWAEDDLAFRKSLHDFIGTKLETEWTGRARQLGSHESVEYSIHFNAVLAERGWLTPHWPQSEGGNGASPWQSIILAEEMWSVGEPRGPQYMNVNWIGPSIMAHGTEDQKRMHLSRIARGNVIWCQGFSEPDAGSDLASLRTKAIRDGDEYIVNGQKIWTSYASEAEFCYLLVRTGATEDRGKGISVLLVPTSTPGFDIHRVGSMVGEHSFHQLFFSDMRVPVSCRLGPENGGWDVVREALAFERVGAPRYARAALLLDEAVEWMAGQRRPLTGELRERVVGARAACEAARVLVYRVIDERARLLPPSPHVYLARAAMVQAERLVGGLLLDIYGLGALEVGSAAGEHLRKSMTAGLAGGSYEMQLNLISRLLLHLPKG
jgi:alkylation response protein AidB-like acyl-CoA dehydrogenase